MNELGIKFMGSDPNGKAQAIKTENDGRIHVSLPNVERASEISAGLRTEIYNEGIEEVAMVEGYASQNGAVQKRADHLFLEVRNNPTNSAVRGFVTDVKIDLTDANWVELDLDMVGTVGYDSRVFLGVSNSKLLPENDYVVRQAVLSNKGVPVKRHKIRLNVSSLTGEYFIKVQLVDGSTVVDVSASANIYGISVLNKAATKITTTTGISALNETGQNVQLSAETDDNGKAVIRVVDAAPAGYDPASDSIKVSSMPRIRKRQMQVPLANMAIGNNDIVINSALNTLAKVTSITFSVGGVAQPASSGTHGILIFEKNVASPNLLYDISTAYWDNLQLYRTHKANGEEGQGTSFEALQQIIYNGLYFGDIMSEDNPLLIRYQNNTDAVRTNTGYILINYIEELIGQ